MTEPVVIKDVQDAIQALDLVTIEFYGIEARRNEAAEASPDTDRDSEVGEMRVETAYRLRDDGLDFRVGITVEESTIRVEADGAVIYMMNEGTAFAPEAIKDFGEMVAAMTIYPYIREAISSAADRVGSRLTLPMLERGEIRFAVEEAAEPT